MGQPETVYTGPQRLECGPRKGWPHWLASRKPGRGEHRVPPPTAAAAMAAAAAATARSSVAPHASPTLRRSGSSGTLPPPPLSHLITTSPSSLFHSYMIWGSPQIRLPVWRRDFSSSKRECQPRIVRDPPAAFCAVRLHKLVY